MKDDLDRADITDDYDVYAISRDDADTNSLPYLTLNAQGKTLYITADQTDLGLAVASDAPVFIWKDGNTSHITKYDTLKEAVEELDDMQGEEAAGKQFRGNIIAALNSNGSAAWIIFDATNYWSANIIDE